MVAPSPLPAQARRSRAAGWWPRGWRPCCNLTLPAANTNGST